MSWRFRRSVKILPGVRLNVSKRSLGLSAGPRGAKVSANTRGEVRRTVGLPGTGLSHTTQGRLKAGATTAPEHVPADELTPEDLAYLKERAFRRVVGWGSFLVIMLLGFAGAVGFAAYLVIPAIVLTVLAPRFARFF